MPILRKKLKLITIQNSDTRTMSKKYIYQNPSWPQFTWNETKLINLLASVRHKQGILLGSMQALGFDFRAEANLEALTADVVKSGAIEGEHLPDDEVRSSLARHLGLEIGGLVPSTRDVDGFVQMMLDATNNYTKELTAERLFTWHIKLFPNAQNTYSTHSPNTIEIGKWRQDTKGRMQVVSGAISKERVHYEAPEAKHLNEEMHKFLKWFNTKNKIDPVIKSAIAHFYFVTLHPFDDGNGRIARAIADMALAQADGCAERFYSMSSAIERKRASYYAVLEQSQKGDLDITSWLCWFIECLDEALNHAKELLQKTMHKAKVWEKAKEYPLNPRQELMLRKLLENFEGKLTSSKYAKIAKCSQDTALRDISELLEHGILKKSEQGGRSTNYEIASNTIDVVKFRI